MNRAQFMEQLKRLLSDIPEAERQEALDYYESYFDDAGEENEAAVIRELGSPGKVAAIIKAELHESSEHYAEYTEKGYEATRTKEPGQMPARRGRVGKQNAKFILIIILLVFASPFISGAASGVLGALVTILLLPFILVFALGAAVLCVTAAGIACGVAGIGMCFASPALGILCIGIGCVLIAVAILLLLLLIWLAGKMLPKLIRKATDVCHNILHRERKDGAHS